METRILKKSYLYGRTRSLVLMSCLAPHMIERINVARQLCAEALHRASCSQFEGCHQNEVGSIICRS